MKRITIALTTEEAEKLDKTCKQFNIKPSDLIKDTIKNFLSFIDIPQDFIEQTKLPAIFKLNIPIRTILPYLSSVLGYKMTNDFVININDKDYKIDPYPAYSMLCGIKLTERLYQTINIFKKKPEVCLISKDPLLGFMEKNNV